MASSPVPSRTTSLGQTQRGDAWWLELLPVVVLFGGFGLYATWRAIEGKLYGWEPYLSPFYSPLIDPSHHWLPKFLSPALLILGAPLGFRTTCYYYRKAYYRAFFLDPPACAVGEPDFRKNYRGETSFPFILQNVHRYFLYLALFFLLVLAYDVWKALWFADGFGIGIGTIVLAINLVLLAGYTVGCHSLRHLAGGFLDQFSKSPTCYRAYTCVSCFNRRHMLWAWLSLFWVGFADLYVRLCAMGVWHDWRLL